MAEIATELSNGMAEIATELSNIKTMLTVIAVVLILLLVFKDMS